MSPAGVKKAGAPASRAAGADARTTLEKRPLKVLRGLAEAGTPDEAARLLGPRVAERHSLEAFREAAGALVAERETARARRLGEPLLSVEEQRALGSAGSRLLGLGEGGSPFAGIADEDLEAVRREMDPARLAERLSALDPEGNWEAVPRVGALAGLVLVAASSESERRYRRKSEADADRVRRARAGASPAP